MEPTYNTTNLEFDNATAKHYFQQGGKLVFLNCPKDFEFGIDFSNWIVGPKFMGLKFIPPGIHFIYYSIVDKTGHTGIRNGFFHYFKKEQIIVKKWNEYNEEVYKDNELEPELNDRIKYNIQSFDPNLGTYPITQSDVYKKWKQLTRYVSSELIQKIAPNDGLMDGFLPTEENSNFEEFDGSLKFTKFDLKKSFPEGSFGSELTKYSLDKSYLLMKLIENEYLDYKNILGEIELSFIVFLLGQNFIGLEQWKKLIVLISNSNEAINQSPNLFIHFLEILYFQLLECPQDFFHDIILENNFLGISLKVNII
ncbi:AAR2-domain-containing protein [Neoconidiobolus thromboides FSU 785]|nr:AAR2-domain-containing protein [Neoconidiobolus thromboides FSU 785]